ncbi:MAG: AAA family ATPase [Fibromonadaceae bacterium]|jgi:predicted ATPase|nr:AAA family ATPase [Fibromonadaceae bacterium]
MPEINEMRKQFSNGQWKKFVSKITIDKLRGWENQSVNFRFPICAIVGENGSGKSTILRASVCAYQNTLQDAKTFYPSQLFLATNWDKMSVPRGTALTYEIKQGDQTITSRWKKTTGWGYSPKSKKPKRDIVFLDVSRTLPLDATAGYAKIAKSSVKALGTVDIDVNLMKAYSDIMGCDYLSARFIQPVVRREIGLSTRNFGEISQFHQGAGEDSLLDLMQILQTIPDTALLVIDEIDASLHPKAQRRLIRFLIKLARQKKLQIIISTHSPYIFDEIPPEGRILIQKLSNGSKDIQYSVSTNYALGQIDDEKHPDLYIYVEDKEAKTLLYEIIKNDTEIISRIEIKIVGDNEVVKTLGKLCRNNKLPDKGIAFLDGDMQDANENCFSLPSNKAPELVVFGDLKAKNWNGLDARFGQGAGNLYSIFDDAITAVDHHDFTIRIGDRLGKSADYVWNLFVEEWCKQCLDPNDKNRIITNIKDALAQV